MKRTRVGSLGGLVGEEDDLDDILGRKKATTARPTSE